MNLPGHIIKKSKKWYFDNKDLKYISAEHIEVWCENYWKYHTSENVKPRVSHNTEVDIAKKRWDLL